VLPSLEDLSAVFLASRDTGWIEAYPAPVTSDLWKKADTFTSNESAKIALPFQEVAKRDFMLAGALMYEAIASWGMNPWDLVFTYGIPAQKADSDSL